MLGSLSRKESGGLIQISSGVVIVVTKRSCVHLESSYNKGRKFKVKDLVSLFLGLGKNTKKTGKVISIFEKVLKDGSRFNPKKNKR